MPIPRRTVRNHELWRFIEELRDAAACLSACRDAVCKAVGLNAERWRALAAIDHSSFVLSISDLARHLRCSRQSAHSLTLGLERAGWIRFLPNQDDRRLLQMEITAAGKSILTSVEHAFNAWLLTMSFDLDVRQLRQLADTLRAVRQRIGRARDYV